MRMLATLPILSVFSVVTFYASSSGGEAPQATVRTVDFQLRANLIVVEVMINRAMKLFVLDTGASGTVVSRRTAQELGLQEAEKAVGRGAGGEVEVSLVRVDSLAVGDLVVRDLTAVVMDLEDLNQRLGGNISGVLGFDFLSRFKVTIDYRAKRLTFEGYGGDKENGEELSVVEGDHFISLRGGISLERPDASWEFVTQTPLPQILLIMRKTDSGATVTIQAQAVHGLSLHQVIPSVEASLAAQVQDFEKVVSGEMKIGGQDAYMLEYRGTKEGAEQRFRHFLIKVEEKLYSLNCRADSSEFVSLGSEFDRIVESISFLATSGRL